jgi:hypothetical protein
VTPARNDRRRRSPTAAVHHEEWHQRAIEQGRRLSRAGSTLAYSSPRLCRAFRRCHATVCWEAFRDNEQQPRCTGFGEEHVPDPDVVLLIPEIKRDALAVG